VVLESVTLGVSSLVRADYLTGLTDELHRLISDAGIRAGCSQTRTLWAGTRAHPFESRPRSRGTRTTQVGTHEQTKGLGTTTGVGPRTNKMDQTKLDSNKQTRVEILSTELNFYLIWMRFLLKNSQMVL
jgi:hypothetical protein